MMSGFSSNYIKVQVPFDRTLINQIVEVELLSSNDEGTLLGKVVK
jgi:hypothetical protein